MSNFESLVAVAESHPIVGWDFSWLDDRLTTTSLNWSYEEFVVDLVKGSPNMLDMDTGGGEWLSGLPKRSPMTVATESWPPNTPVAAKRLKPFGISVVQVEPAPDNSEQTPSESRGRLPFADEFFHLITNRHASFLASEVSRVLARGGTFITQQLGCEGSYAEVFEALEVSPPAPSRPWNLGEAVRQVEGSG
ncbi:MAG: class I SAM-dependent methyltransferase, partial [Acidimicrobiia bacterium]